MEVNVRGLRSEGPSIDEARPSLGSIVPPSLSPDPPRCPLPPQRSLLCNPSHVRKVVRGNYVVDVLLTLKGEQGQCLRVCCPQC